MKRLSIALLFVALFATMAFAGVQSFGEFSVDVADGWTATQNGPTAVIVKDDKTASLSITVASTQGYSLDDLAAAFAEEFKKTFASVGTPEKDADGDYTFSAVTPNGVETRFLLAEDDGEYLMFAITGEDDDISTMISSIQEN